jgi:hypothetical protein
MIGISFGFTDLVPAPVTFYFVAYAVCLLLLYLMPMSNRLAQSLMLIA